MKFYGHNKFIINDGKNVFFFFKVYLTIVGEVSLDPWKNYHDINRDKVIPLFLLVIEIRMNEILSDEI